MPPGDVTHAALIAVDWGTSRLRAWLVDSHGSVLDEAASEEGIGRLDGGHERVFEALVSRWPAVPALLAGMIGSRQGWREAPYVPCPATSADIAAKVIRFETGAGRSVAIVPGLVVGTGDGDVIRGEETQIVGLADTEPSFAGTLIMPGTHSKWVSIDRGTIAGFQTFMTGELFELLSHKSFLRHSVAESGADLSASPEFTRAVERTTAEALPFLAGLFPVRARQLLGRVQPEDNLAYLSGLVIGGEIAAARATGRLGGGAAVRIVGSKSLARAYTRALSVAGYASEPLDGSALAIAGLLHIARTVGFLPREKA